MGLVRFLVIFLAFILVARLIRLYVLPFLFKKAATRMQDQMRERMNPEDKRKEGEIRVEKGSKDEGEFTEYEELD
jgi:flagellar biosynthesis/type III secretory pathway M-ring protein FliF/YscJ